jgi:hypothetical protein
MTDYPFKTTYSTIEANPDQYINTVFEALKSSFLVMPRGSGFVAYPEFQQAYEVLKRYTGGFTSFEAAQVLEAIQENGLVFVVMRAILGLTPPELAHIASVQAIHSIPQGAARALDRRFRMRRLAFQSLSKPNQVYVEIMVQVACQLVQQGIDKVTEEVVHRLDKADTRTGLSGLRHLATEGVPYAMLLYERFLGRPFASHRDSVSELVGEVMESAVEQELRKAGISYRKTKRAEKLEGFDQAPDFVVPDEFNPQVVIEAKITEDDGTARDKVTRIQHLQAISEEHERRGKSGFQVVACIDGRGFGVRREDMRKLLQATRGKVFTLSTLHHLIEYTNLNQYRSLFPAE